MLEALALQRGAAGRASGQDPPPPHVAQGPGQVAHPLKAEHRIEQEHREHRLPPGGVGGGQGGEGGQRAGFGDPFLEDLARGALGVVQRQVGVDRHVVLPLGGVDLRLGDDGLEAERAGFVRHDGSHQLAHGGVAHEVAQESGEGHGGRDRLFARARGELLEDLVVGQEMTVRAHDPRRHRAGQHTATGAQVLHGIGSLGGPHIGRVTLQGGVWNVVGQIQPIPQGPQLGLGHLLDLMRGVTGFDLGPQRPTLDRLGQDHGGRAPLFGGQLVGGIELAIVVPAPGERDQLVVAQVIDQFAQPRIGAEEVLADIRPGFDGQLLVLAVHGGVHAVEQDTVDVPGQEGIPSGSPDHLDHIPPGASIHRLELLNDLPVPAHRPVQPLQVAVDDEDEVVEMFATGHTEGADRLRLVHLAVTDEAPDAAGAGVDQVALVQVAVDVRLVDGVDRSQAHGNGGELPEVRQRTGVGVTGQAVAAHLVTEVVQLGLGQPPLEERSRVDTRRGVSLNEHLVPEPAVGLAPEEVVEPDFVERGGAGVGGEVASDALGAGVGPHDHGGGVPADVGPDPALLVLVAGKPRLVFGGDRVDIGSGNGGGEVDLLGPGPLQQLHEEVAGAGSTT